MFDLFSAGIQKDFSKEVFKQMSRQNQDRVLQGIYDANHSVGSISNFFGIPKPTLYVRIKAHRGRSAAVVA